MLLLAAAAARLRAMARPRRPGALASWLGGALGARTEGEARLVGPSRPVRWPARPTRSCRAALLWAALMGAGALGRPHPGGAGDGGVRPRHHAGCRRWRGGRSAPCGGGARLGRRPHASDSRHHRCCSLRAASGRPRTSTRSRARRNSDASTRDALDGQRPCVCWLRAEGRGATCTAPASPQRPQRAMRSPNVERLTPSSAAARDLLPPLSPSAHWIRSVSICRRWSSSGMAGDGGGWARHGRSHYRGAAGAAVAGRSRVRASLGAS